MCLRRMSRLLSLLRTFSGVLLSIISGCRLGHSFSFSVTKPRFIFGPRIGTVDLVARKNSLVVELLDGLLSSSSITCLELWFVEGPRGHFFHTPPLKLRSWICRNVNARNATITKTGKSWLVGWGIRASS
jgi:hypothetical protein